MVIKLYNTFHDHGSKPEEKYMTSLRPALLCGADLEWRHTDDIECDYRDNTGINISSENTQYSELTGYYWIWKNESPDIIGIEHYRRHFIKHKPVIDDNVQPDNLLDEKDIIDILVNYDYIVPVHESLINFSIYDLYKLCFPDQADSIIKNMLRYFKEQGLQNYYDAILNYMSHNSLFRANMLITTRLEFDRYCNTLFTMIDYLKENMKVEKDSRIWGYVAELFPMIYITANNKSFKEIDVAIDDFDQDIQKKVVYTTLNNKDEDYSEKNPDEIISLLKSL